MFFSRGEEQRMLTDIMGMVGGLNLFFSRGEEQRVLTDIMGMEDFLGDMDFKLAATRYLYLLLNIFIVPMFI